MDSRQRLFSRILELEAERESLRDLLRRTRWYISVAHVDPYLLTQIDDALKERGGPE